MNSTLATAAIERTLTLRASPERVWSALTRPEELSAWLGQRADVRLEVGYDGWVEWDGHGRFPIRVVEVVPLRRFAFRWMNEAADALDPATATLVEWQLEPIPGGGTRLHLRETGFDTMAARTGNAVGWLGELGELVEFVAEQPRDVGVRRSWRLDAPVKVLWEALTDQIRLAAWWQNAPGGPIRAESLEAGTYVAWLWAPTTEEPTSPADTVSVEWALEPASDGRTELRLLMTGFVSGEALREAAAFIDDMALPALQRLIASDGGRP